MERMSSSSSSSCCSDSYCSTCFSSESSSAVDEELTVAELTRQNTKLNVLLSKSTGDLMLDKDSKLSGMKGSSKEVSFLSLVTVEGKLPSLDETACEGGEDSVLKPKRVSKELSKSRSNAKRSNPSVEVRVQRSAQSLPVSRESDFGRSPAGKNGVARPPHSDIRRASLTLRTSKTLRNPPQWNDNRSIRDEIKMTTRTPSQSLWRSWFHKSFGVINIGAAGVKSR
eukprot:CAMPEP_0185832744 /NCGR_PEP_ID=MMETSP1353-20130828/2264_1 /TAXON_ID=1077150 /ORGANISM="Erythrolobus australicus, Strain CCMP3124" /LENGTH=225 /DNA_ID=CAMNT_0028530957 /DNA_START=102 /DNA_END=779 /DNA_ORIENTATION=+